jgi:hypothetical protein
MSRVPEKLAVLLDVGQGLLTRFHQMSNFATPPVLLSKELDDITIHLEKSFPNYPAGTEKVAGFLVVLPSVF